jgi:hypothetical protein
MKRLSSSCSAAAPKRQNDDIEELKCSICFDLAVDAVQVSCCGALHCSDCISKCAACPMCRNAVVRWVSDFRRERLSAAALRQCPNQGCAFEGNRASLMAHQEECDFLPRVFLKHKLSIYIPLQAEGLAHLHMEGSGKFCQLPRLFLDVSRCRRFW